jgi:hypothetical protein
MGNCIVGSTSRDEFKNVLTGVGVTGEGGMVYLNYIICLNEKFERIKKQLTLLVEKL